MKRIELKKLMGYCLIIVMIFTMLPINVVKAGTTSWENYKSQPSGTGKSDSPYQITKAEELAYAAYQVNRGSSSYVSGYYELTQDIDLAAHQWIPIGTQSKRFQGHFNGKGHNISNLIMGTASSSNTTDVLLGLFGASSGIVENVEVDVNMVSAMSNSTMNVYVGVVGYNSGTIINSCATGNVAVKRDNKYFVGGLVGYNEGKIYNSCSTVNVTVDGNNNYVGGLAGTNIAKINNSYAAGTVAVTGTSKVGGLLGATTQVITNNYYNTDVASTAIGQGGESSTVIGKTSAEMQSEAFVNDLNTNKAGYNGWNSWVYVSDNYPTSVKPGLASTLTVTISPGTAIGSTQAKITETAASKFVVNITDTEISTPVLLDNAPTSGDNRIDNYTSEGDITKGAAENKYLQVYDVDADGKVAGFYQKKLEASDIKQPSYWKDNIGSVTSLTGSGTEAAPYQISSAEELSFMAKKINDGDANYKGAYYELTQDIDLAAHQWTPIGIFEGDFSRTFCGHFDGKKHKISNVYIGTESSPDTTYDFPGLFGYSSGTIENIGVSVSIYSAKDGKQVGGLIGENITGAIINNSYVTGNITGGNNAFIGGLAGRNGGLINNSYSIANVVGGDSAVVGGLVGYHYGTGDYIGEINNSYAAGNITGGSSAKAGGLVGECHDGSITNGYYNTNATQKVDGSEQASTGIGGDNNSQTTIGKTSLAMKLQEFVNELNTNKAGHDDWNEWVSAPGNYPTCIVTAVPASALTVTLSPGTKTGSTKAKITETAASKFVVNITDTEISTPTTLDTAPTNGDNRIDSYTSEGDITKGVAENKYLQVYAVDANGKVAGFYQKKLEASDIKQPSYWKDSIGDILGFNGEGTEEKPYQIGNAEEIAYLAEVINEGNNTYTEAYYELTADIDLAAHQWTPIGDSSNTFQGHFDGKGHEISHVIIGTTNSPNTTYTYLGLFGCNCGTINNLGVSVSIISSRESTYIGGLVGFNDEGVIKNSYAEGTVIGGDGACVGGLVGQNDESIISNSYATGSVVCGKYQVLVMFGGNMHIPAVAGGFAGRNNGDINNSYAAGSVTGGAEALVGGFVGFKKDDGITMTGYYNSDETQMVGGTVQSTKAIGKGTGNAYGIPDSMMKASSQKVEGALVDRLNKGIGSNSDWYAWKQDADVNSGYPRLVMPKNTTLPTIETKSPATNITTTSVTVGGNVTSDGKGTLSEVGIVYGTTENPTIDTATTVSAKSVMTGAFSVDLTGLTPDTTYHARAYAVNEAGTAYGSDISFTTSEGPPAPNPLSAPTISLGSVGDGFANIQWNDVPKAEGYKIYKDSQTVVDAVYTVTGYVYSYKAASLKNGTQYAFKVKAVNKDGESVFSNTVNATPTASPKPPVKTYTVGFDSQGGSVVSDKTDVSNDTTITAPTAPTRSGYIFKGWYKEAACTNPWNFESDTVTSNIILFAKWTKKPSEDSNPNESSGSGGGTSTSQNQDKGIKVIVNGQEQTAGKEVVKEENGKKAIELIVDSKVVNQKIEEVIKAQLNQTDENKKAVDNVIEVPVTNENADKITTTLTGDIIKNMDKNEFKLLVKSKGIDYIIPADQFTISKVGENLGLKEEDLADIKVEVKITKVDEKVVEKYNEVAKVNGAELVFPPVEFEIVAKTTKEDGTTQEQSINKFSNYVERVMEIPGNVDPSKITTGIVFNADGTYSHVPTEVFQKDNKWYAKLNSLTNSEYSVVWNPVTVKSVENHWAKEAVNDMASRLVIYNPEEFEPNKAITRADFAEYIVRALGLYREGSTHKNNFKDVSVTGERTLAILIANEYGIVSGYSDGTFKGDNPITREEAMTMYGRAMDIVKLKGTDEGRIESYKDQGEVSKWAYDSVKKTLSAGVFNGRTSDEIAPKGNLTYAEAATAVRNLLIEAHLINQ